MIYLVRHGESSANINKRFCGITDVELSDLGKKQAAEVSLYFKDLNISKIYSSPLKRAYDTAMIISLETEVDVIKAGCLAEVNFGIFENMTWDEIAIKYKEETDSWISLGHNYKFPKGESYADIINRIADFIENIEENTVIVTHFGVIQSILLYLKIADSTDVWNYHISNCDILVLNNKKFDKIIKCKY